jgi:hypothetical protein
MLTAIWAVGTGQRSVFRRSMTPTTPSGDPFFSCIPLSPFGLSAPNIQVNGFFSVDRAKPGSRILGAVVLTVPGGFHVNANRPLNRYAIPTVLTIEAPSEFSVGAVRYPRPRVRRLKSVNNEQLAVYEGRAIIHFHFVVPPKVQATISLVARLRFQSCSDDTCFAPENREISMSIPLTDGRDRASQIHREIFGRKD